MLLRRRQDTSLCSRREALHGLAALGLASISASTGRWAIASTDDPAPEGLIVRCPRPLDAETPTSAFVSWLTPADRLFIRSHFGAPTLPAGPWRVRVGGLVDRPFAFNPDAGDDLERVTIPAVLQCAGNGRGLFEPKVGGVGWGRGAVGNAEWTGVRLRDLLERAGLDPRTRHVHLIGADAPPNPKTPAYLRSIPISRALDPNTIVATLINGEPLPGLHGGPARLVVPGWTGNHWLKWLAGLEASESEAPGFYQQTGYKLPKTPKAPGDPVPPSDLVPVTEMNVKSLIALPAAGALLDAGRIEVRGVAWTGPGRVVAVEVSANDGPWRPSTFVGPDVEFAWRLWRAEFAAEPGPLVLRARATDSNGDIQPIVTPWNKSGYLWNGIDEIRCEVR